jgi:hypothetical protein
MRLPLRHRPPERPEPSRRCAYLEQLAEDLVGVPLGSAARLIASRRSRGRHGNALQWHLGLSSHDGAAELDWEDRIEIKLVTVWSRGGPDDPRVGSDKLKVCDLGVDPWHKLANVLFVHADRLTRVVVGARLFHLDGARLARLATSWDEDPHFGHPYLFVEAREQEGRRAPAYYVSARWLEDEGILPEPVPPIFEFDAAWWNRARTEHGREPLLTLGRVGERQIACPRCGGPITIESDRLAKRGWSPARHGMPLGDACALTAHVVVDASRLRTSHSCSPDEFAAALENRVESQQVWRLADRVPEPDDHLHSM